MVDRLDHRERFQALSQGITPDRAPIALWRHFYKDEDDLDLFVEAMVGWQRKYDWDFLKINPRASYHYEPWGVRMRPSPDRLTKPERVEFPVQNLEDWLKVNALSPSHPQFDFQLRAISRIRKLLPRPFPMVMTVFNPISIMGDMVSSDNILLSHLRESPDAVESALGAITSSFVRLVQEFRDAGADGIFFATTQWASAERLSEEELSRFALPYDRQIWRATGDDAFNVLHVCDRKIYLSAYRDFGAAVANWDVSLEGNPALRAGHAMLASPVMGGIHHETALARDSAHSVYEATKHLIAAHRDIPFALGPGCAIPVTTPLDNISAVRLAVEYKTP